MSELQGVLVVNRMNLLCTAIKAGVSEKRRPSLAMSYEDIFNKYRGFDGDVRSAIEKLEISAVNGLAKLEELPTVLHALAESDPKNECDVIYLRESRGGVGCST